ncbi:hypothetical protein [Streptomyces sp. NPDC005969]
MGDGAKADAGADDEFAAVLTGVGSRLRDLRRKFMPLTRHLGKK